MVSNAFRITGLLVLAALSGCGRGSGPRVDVGPVPESPATFSPKARDERVAVLRALLDQELATAPAARARRLKFFKAIAPAAVATMLEIESERATVLAYRSAKRKGEKPAAAVAKKIETLFERYRAKDADELLLRTDAVPLDLLFTQASVESAAGTSPVARDCLNLFGVHAADKSQSCAGHPILAKYPDFTGSIKRYVLLLNSGSAYRSFRKIRAAQRAEVGDAGALDSIALLEGLLAYSERGRAYVSDIGAGIRADKLDRLYREYVARIAR